MTPTDTATVELTLPDAPAIPGLRFRQFRDASDWAPLADLQKAVAIADRDDEIQSAENLQIDVENKPGFRDCAGPADRRGRRADRRSADGTATIRDGHPVHYLFGRVHPDWRRRGIGRALFRWNERRARDRAAAEPEFAGPGAVLGSWASEFEPGAQALYESEGYEVVRYAFTMIQRHVQDADPIPMPEGIELRPVTPDQHRPIFDADDEAFRDHFEHRAATEQDFVATFSSRTSTPRCGRSAGTATRSRAPCRPGSGRRRTRRSARSGRGSRACPCAGRGAGAGSRRALIAASLVDLRERGIEEALLGVDAENPTGALALYEGLASR